MIFTSQLQVTQLHSFVEHSISTTLLLLTFREAYQYHNVYNIVMLHREFAL